MRRVAIVRSDFIVGQPGAVGASDRHRFVEDRYAQRVHVSAPKHRLPLQRQRGDRVGNSVDQQLPPGQRREIAAQDDTQRRAVEQLRKCLAVAIVRHREIVLAGVAKPNAIGTEPLAVEVDDGRNDRGTCDQRRDAGDVANSVLQHGDPRRRIAEPPQPRGGRRRLMTLRAEEHPVDPLCARGIVEGV